MQLVQVINLIFYRTPSRRIIQIEKVKHKRQQDLCMCELPGDPGYRVANLNEVLYG